VSQGGEGRNEIVKYRRLNGY